MKKGIMFHPILPPEVIPHYGLPNCTKVPLNTYVYWNNSWHQVIFKYHSHKGHHWHEVPLKFVPKELRALALLYT